MGSWTSFSFQDASSPVMEEFMFFHDHTMFILIFFVSLVLYIMGVTILSKFYHITLLNNHFLEITWTVAPIICLVQIALPSLMLLYVMEEFIECSVALKATGHQWYWKYEYTDFYSRKYEGGVEFDSFMMPSNTLEENKFRLLDVDNRAILPVFSYIRVLITSADVIHSWALPSLGVKTDACPGRINQTSFISVRHGVLFGQCSEICGANHSFMPIVVEFTNNEMFLNWILSLWEGDEEGLVSV